MTVISAIPVYSFIIISIQCIHTVTLYNDNVWSFISDTLILIYSYIWELLILWYSQISSTIFHQYRFCEKFQMPIGNAYVKAAIPCNYVFIVLLISLSKHFLSPFFLSLPYFPLLV